MSDVLIEWDVHLHGTNCSSFQASSLISRWRSRPLTPSRERTTSSRLKIRLASRKTWCWSQRRTYKVESQQIEQSKPAIIECANATRRYQKQLFASLKKSRNELGRGLDHEAHSLQVAAPQHASLGRATLIFFNTAHEKFSDRTTLNYWPEHSNYSVLQKTRCNESTCEQWKTRNSVCENAIKV